MQKIYFVVVGKIKESFYREAVAEYVKRLSRFAKVEIKELPEGVDPEAEKGDILRACKGYVIALAVEGEKLSFDENFKSQKTDRADSCADHSYLYVCILRKHSR
jgi:23S rRNA (pseudouridine1915-N3)-methyltransferase